MGGSGGRIWTSLRDYVLGVHVRWKGSRRVCEYRVCMREVTRGTAWIRVGMRGSTSVRVSPYSPVFWPKMAYPGTVTSLPFFQKLKDRTGPQKDRKMRLKAVKRPVYQSTLILTVLYRFFRKYFNILNL